MEALFLKLLDMGVSANWPILAVIAARFLLRNAPKSVRCILWALVALRLACPVRIPSPVSFAPKTTAVEQILTEREVTIPRQIPTFRNQDGVTPDNAESSKPESASASVRLTEIFSAVWLAGLSAMSLYALAGFLRLRRTVSASLPTGKNLWICDDIPAPFILGILRPRVYLPSNLDEAQARYVIAHENAHLRHYDHFWKPLGYSLLSVYWFHPLVWVAYVLFCRDLELACDERVVREMKLSERAAYSQALLDCSRERGNVAACPLAFGETGVKTRVRAVLNYRKPAFWIVIASVIVSAVVAICFMTSPPTVRNPAVRDYVPGTGNIRLNVDAASFEEISADFAIGADKNGVAVFKNPRKAFNMFRELYADAIREIQEAHDLPPITEDYSGYLKYGWQMDAGETAFVSKFLDIYENSFGVRSSATNAEPTLPVVSIDPADYGITEAMLSSLEMPDFSALSLEALGAYFLHTDGAGAEGSGDELHQRFINNPDAVLHYIASLEDVKARGEDTAAAELCREIASADVFRYGGTADFTEILREFPALYPDGSIAAVLEVLEAEYNAAMERANAARFLSPDGFAVSDNGNDGAVRLVAEMPVLGGKLKQVETRVHYDFRGYDTVHELFMAPTGKEFGIESGYLLYSGETPPGNVVYDRKTETVTFEADGQTFVYDARSWAKD